MRKDKFAFERVPVEEVRRLLEQQNNAEKKSEELTDGDKGSKRIAPNQSPSPRNVQKRRAHPKRSIRTEGEDHPLGLWIDKEILRKHQNRPPQIALHDPILNSNNRYLELADSVLTQNKSKRDVNDKAWRTRA